VARKPRLEIPGFAYHLTANAVDGSRAFRHDVDREHMLYLLGDVAVESEWCVLEYAVLSTHYHLLVILRKPTLSSGMQRLQGRYARYFNRDSKRIGALWRARYGDVMIESDGHLREVVRYIARNAPRAGICERPEDYPWCSYGAAIGGYTFDPLIDERELLSLFGADVRSARRALRAFVEESDPRKRRGQIRVRDRSGGPFVS
jgi:putative transposase